MKTNIEFVEFLKMACDEKWGYVWGTFGNVLTESLLKYKIDQYGNQVRRYEHFIRENWLNKRTVDCIGLLKAFLWWDGTNAQYNSKSDHNANVMYQKCTEKGTIDTIPEIIGLVVWKQGHIGYYIGKGKVIEAHGTKYGVIETELHETGWTHWGKCHLIEYKKTDDITGSWAEKEIRAVIDAGLMSGYPDGTFRPNEPFTRAQKAYMLAHEKGLV